MARPAKPVPSAPVRDKSFTRFVYDNMMQLATSLLIPLSVAGMGWYYTYWQQNVADLKTMIELVTDEKADKRKYGIAMFEYLLKNDRVPVEFISAQLNFANSASDQALLPQMEQAIAKAAAVNPRVAVSFKEAAARLPSRVFVQGSTPKDGECARKLIAGFKDTERGEVTIPSVRIYPDYAATTHELRFFRTSDKDTAEAIREKFAILGLEIALKDTTAYSGARDFRPNTFELWLGKAPLPAICFL